MHASLDGLRVINTRPAGRGAELDDALQQSGAIVEHLPLLETLPCEPEPGQRAWLMDLDRYQAVFVVSPTAAELGLRQLEDYWPQWPLGPIWIAVGAATAKVLTRAGLAPRIPDIETSEGVLAIPELSALGPGDRVLVLRGEGGRNLVREWLQARSVRVDYLDLYRRHLPEQSAARWLEIRRRRPDAVILTSGESLHHWLQVAGQEASALPAVVISPRLARLAREQGLATVLDAGAMTPGAIVDALRSWRQVAGHDID